MKATSEKISHWKFVLEYGFEKDVDTCIKQMQRALDNAKAINYQKQIKLFTKDIAFLIENRSSFLGDK